MSTRTRWILAGVAVLLFAAAVFAGGFHCSRVFDPPAPVAVDIDAGPGLAVIDAAEDTARRKAELELEAIEAKRRADLEAFTAAEREAYEAVRAQGPDAVVDWLNDFDRQRFGPRGSP